MGSMCKGTVASGGTERRPPWPRKQDGEQCGTKQTRWRRARSHGDCGSWKRLVFSKNVEVIVGLKQEDDVPKSVM